MFSLLAYHVPSQTWMNAVCLEYASMGCATTSKDPSNVSVTQDIFSLLTDLPALIKMSVRDHQQSATVEYVLMQWEPSNVTAIKVLELVPMVTV